MKFFVGVTDYDWYQQLMLDQASEVNFWLPSPDVGFRYLEPGEPFLFKLHSPRNYIVGGGYFAGYSAIPVSMAWDAFGRNNGVPDRQALLTRIKKYREGSKSNPDPDIGCIILTDPFYFEERDWIPQPAD